MPQRPLTPQVLFPEAGEESAQRPVSVRALTSRFECATTVSDSNNENVGMSCVQHNTSCTPPRQSSAVVDPHEAARVMLHRQRSKSESESLAEQAQRPKSVLAKRSKNYNRLNKPRKSVTFSADICLAAEGGWATTGNSNEEGHVMVPQISGRKTEDTDSSTSDFPVEVFGEGACTLCHKQGVETGQSYCAKCTYYMSKFTPR